MSTRARLFFLLLSLFLANEGVQAQTEGNIFISEIAWMGTLNSAFDEWLELYNGNNQAVDLTGWQLSARDGSPLINLSGTINPNSYFLLERTDEKTLPLIQADLIYKGGLNNKGEELILINKEGELVDYLDCSSGWFFGSNKEKTTMERKEYINSSDKNIWQTSKESGGTPRSPNSQGEKEEKTKTKEGIISEENEETLKENSGIGTGKKSDYVSLITGVIIAFSSAGIALYFKKEDNRN
jgi:hypothetical protein